MSQTAREIAWRYQCDNSELSAQLRFVRSKIDVTDASVTELNAELQKHGFAPIAERPPNQWGHKTPYSSKESASLLEPLEAVGKEIWKREYALTGENVAAMRTQSKSTWGEITESAIKMAIGVFPRNLPTEKELAAIRETVKDRLKGQVDENGDAIDLDHVMRVARHRRRYNETLLLQALWGKVSTLRSAAASHHPEKQTSIYRQAFILLMTHFDAAVFDLVRLALRTNFFPLAAHFGDKEKIAYSRFGEHNDFDSFRDSLIEELLRARYVKDLLFELNELGVELPDQRFGGFPRLIELVLRRNIHLHNRGFVDMRYLETNREGKPLWNLDGFSLGAAAVIDEAYFINASNACGEYIGTLANWVSAGAMSAASSSC
jgi:hypothetical protein